MSEAADCRGAADGAGIAPPLPLAPSGVPVAAVPTARGLLPAPTCASLVVGTAAGPLDAVAGALPVPPATPGVGASLRWHAASSTTEATAATDASRR